MVFSYQEKTIPYYSTIVVVVLLSPAGSVCGINNKLLLMEYVALKASPSWNLLITHLSDVPFSIQEKPMLNLLFSLPSYMFIRGAPFPGLSKAQCIQPAIPRRNGTSTTSIGQRTDIYVRTSSSFYKCTLYHPSHSLAL